MRIMNIIYIVWFMAIKTLYIFSYQITNTYLEESCHLYYQLNLLTDISTYVQSLYKQLCTSVITYNLINSILLPVVSL